LQVQIGSHSFTFDHVYGSTGTPSAGMFDECVAPLVEGLFQGYNATVLAYGQVWSGLATTLPSHVRQSLCSHVPLMLPHQRAWTTTLGPKASSTACDAVAGTEQQFFALFFPSSCLCHDDR
jgi:hypothetical protein